MSLPNLLHFVLLSKHYIKLRVCFIRLCYVFQNLHQTSSNWTEVGPDSGNLLLVFELISYTYFTRIICAISCNDIIFFCKFLKKISSRDFLSPILLQTLLINFHLFFRSSSPCFIAPLPFYFELKSKEKVEKF